MTSNFDFYIELTLKKPVTVWVWWRFHEPTQPLPERLFLLRIGAKARPAAVSTSTKQRQGLPKNKASAILRSAIFGGENQD